MKEKLIGEYLIAEKRITPNQLEQALETQANRLQGGQAPLIGNILLEMGAVNENDITFALDQQERDRMRM
jgi:hypothetical protein